MKVLVCFLGIILLTGAVSGDPYNVTRSKVQKLHKQRNFKEAYDLLGTYASKADVDPGQPGQQDFNIGFDCLNQLQRQSEFDGFLEELVEAHSDQWKVLQRVAQGYLSIPQHGFIIAGEFKRGQHRGGSARYVNTHERDRMRSLQVYKMALDAVGPNDNKAEVAGLYYQFANTLSHWRSNGYAWRMQYLSDLSLLPDYSDGYHHGYGREQKGAPVDAEGHPVYYDEPESWEKAANDGERWRWVLAEAARLNPSLAPSALRERADFLYNQFGVQTMAQYSWYFSGRQVMDDGKLNESGTYDLHTLKDSETIARLATGIKRFELPDEQNFIKLYAELKAHDQLASVYLNRRQYPDAAAQYKKLGKNYAKMVAQIEGNWGQIQPTVTQPAGTGPELQYRFRNGKRVQFTAHRIKVDLLLADVRTLIESKPKQLNWQKINVANLGYRIVQQNETKYVGGQAASWKVNLHPLKKNFDRQVTVATPLQEPGAYLITAKMADGNESKIVLWVSDTVIVKKRIASNRDQIAGGGKADKKASDYYFVADARTGEPIAGAELDFFGYWQEYVDPKIGRPYQRIHSHAFKGATDRDGQLIPDRKDLLPDTRHSPQYLITARTKTGRFAYLGFSSSWYNDYHDQAYNQVKIYGITDRPVYRPNQTMNVKAWARRAQYDMENQSSFAGKQLSFTLYNPKNEKVFSKSVAADAFGGADMDWAIPEDAPLGTYRVQFGGAGNGQITFRVEEYKKPEFEVTIDAPVDPVALGEKISATIKADFYFGAPVTKAQVKYKVTRVSHDSRWYPYRPWDWFYGKGYWWFGYDYTWYPGWSNWGCVAPSPWWWPAAHQQPEIVLENEVAIGPDGSVVIEIDTLPAKEMHGDKDHKYTITAEVTDESRRTIVGQGQVIVARQPFKVYAWVDRGYYNNGDVVQASFSARRPDSKPVQGTGEVTLYSVTYDEGEPKETVVERWKLNTDDEGLAALQLTAGKPGQYRLSYQVTDAQNHTLEGAYLFVVRGQTFNADDARFNDIELVLDREQYAPGDEVKMMINTDQKDSTVLLFIRPSNGIYLPPRLIRIKGKSAVETITISKKDMPNIFVEAVTVAKGKVFTQVREVIVPPEKRVITVEVEPSEERYLPGQEAKVRVRLTDQDGKPVLGTSVISVYDKSVEYISGGSNVGDIKEFFWKWRRRHNSQVEHNLERYGRHITQRNKADMQHLGVFGASVVDVMDAGALSLEEAPGPRSMRMMSKSAAPMADSAPMAGMAMEADSLDTVVAGVGGGGAGGASQAPTVQPMIRKNFADTAFWNAAVETDDDGYVEVSFKMPENLAGWKVNAWALGHGTRVGEGHAEVVTAKNILVRLQAPRFFVEKDEVVLSGNVHNYLDHNKKIKARLELDGAALALIDGEQERLIEVEANGEMRVDWRVKVLKEGEAIVRMLALTDEESDAVEMKFPTYVHGMLKTESFSGVLRPADTKGDLLVKVPAERRVDETRLEIRYSPTLAGAMVDALPYLADYPYGCTEQTLSRFLPAAMTQKILLDMGIDLEDVKAKRTNLNAQEIGDDKERAGQWQRYPRNPVWDRALLNDMVDTGVKRLEAMQLNDGGWGWFSGWGEHSSEHTTAYVVHGLQIARQNDVEINAGTLSRGITWLKAEQKKRVAWIKAKPERVPNNLDAFVFMVLTDAQVENDAMQKLLYQHREMLSLYGKALFGIALHTLGEEVKRDMLIRNIEQFLVEDAENQTAYLNMQNNGYWWSWYGSEYEAHAYYLKLLTRTDPKGAKASGLVKYLLNNRKHATYWKSTRDTAICLEAFAEFLRATNEHQPDTRLEVLVDGRKVKEVHITKDNLFTFDNQVLLEGESLSSGEHTISFRKQGEGPLYYNAYLTNFTLEDYITKAGLEVKVERKIYRLNPADKTVKAQGARGQAVDQKVEKYERELLADLATLKSGDLVEVELEIESKNDYEYLIFEDMKAAGFEPVEVRSGYNGNDMGAYVEFRDEKVAFFVRSLARGKHSVSYRLRAEIPGRFSALPARGFAMYAPELKANSDEIKLKIED
ncbi:MAG: hypothetical protein ACI9QL_000917 [Candidatus Omnitrophota bacterium]|jgi:uncharacterized protein YfaS (alpha-2-macroglobulin family)